MIRPIINGIPATGYLIQIAEVSVLQYNCRSATIAVYKSSRWSLKGSRLYTHRCWSIMIFSFEYENYSWRTTRFQHSIRQRIFDFRVCVLHGGGGDWYFEVLQCVAHFLHEPVKLFFAITVLTALSSVDRIDLNYLYTMRKRVYNIIIMITVCT